MPVLVARLLDANRLRDHCETFFSISVKYDIKISGGGIRSITNGSIVFIQFIFFGRMVTHYMVV